MRACSFAALAAVTLAAVAGAASCGSSTDGSTFTPDAGAPPGDDASPNPGFDAAPIVHDDFHDPVFDNGATPNAPVVFGNADVAPGATEAGAAGAGACLFEPEVGTLFPQNWLRPRFRFTTVENENLFEIKLVVPNETSPLVIYTTKSGYVLDKALWSKLAQFGVGTVHLTLRSAVVDASGNLVAGPFAGTAGDVEIAPVDATGSIVYWTTSDGTALKGFAIGDETVQPVITPMQAGTACVACHTSTPDGLYAGVTGSTDINNGTGPASIAIKSVDGKATEPPFLTASAKTLLGRLDQHAPTFSKAHWQTGDHTVATMLNMSGKTEIVWTDLESNDATQGKGWDVLSRAPDTNAASSAAFSHDGTKLLYVSTSTSAAGVIVNDGKIFTVDWNNRAGGNAKAVDGAHDAASVEFYPTYAADDQLIAFNRVPLTAAPNKSYNDPLSEVYVVPPSGATSATRLAANDPPACLGAKSPGVTNSWPKWSPEVKQANGSSYYFLVFSSTRNAATAGPQLYVAPIVVTNGVIKTYSALYLWNQPETEHNHTPAWDVFQLPSGVN